MSLIIHLVNLYKSSKHDGMLQEKSIVKPHFKNEMETDMQKKGQKRTKAWSL